MKDYYKILHLNNTATSSEIKRSYRRLAMVYHPDRSTQNDSHDIFAEINEAYEILSDPSLKAQYDNLFNSNGDLFAETQIFDEQYQRSRNSERTQRVYRATRKTKDIVTPYILKIYTYAAYVSIAFMCLLLLDFILPDLRNDETVIDKRFGDNNIMEYMLITKNDKVIVEQEVYTKFSIGDAFTYEKSSLFGFDKYISKTVDGVIHEYDLPGNFSKFFTFFIIINMVLAILTIRSYTETDILQYGTANFYLSLILIVSVFVVY